MRALDCHIPCGNLQKTAPYFCEAVGYNKTKRAIQSEGVLLQHSRGGVRREVSSKRLSIQGICWSSFHQTVVGRANWQGIYCTSVPLGLDMSILWQAGPNLIDSTYIVSGYRTFDVHLVTQLAGPGSHTGEQLFDSHVVP